MIWVLVGFFVILVILYIVTLVFPVIWGKKTWKKEELKKDNKKSYTKTILSLVILSFLILVIWYDYPYPNLINYLKNFPGPFSTTMTPSKDKMWVQKPEIKLIAPTYWSEKWQMPSDGHIWRVEDGDFLIRVNYYDGSYEDVNNLNNNRLTLPIKTFQFRSNTGKPMRVSVSREESRK